MGSIVMVLLIYISNGIVATMIKTKITAKDDEDWIANYKLNWHDILTWPKILLMK